jgi:4-amino-4-deoxy-L-arabinose transferase-like glycosyltransferase
VHLGCLIWLCIIVFLLGRRTAQLHNDQVVYASIALQMVESGDYLKPRYQGMPYFNKPPLVFWLAALSARIFGESAVALSLPSSMAAIGAVLLTCCLARRWFGDSMGLLAGWILATSPFFIRNCALLRLDAPVVCAVTAAILLIEIGAARPKALLGVGPILALGILAKGAAALLPLPVYLAAALWTRNLYPFKHPAFWWGVVFGLAIAAPWHIYMALTEPAFAAVHLGAEQVERLSPPFSLSRLLAFLEGNPWQLVRYHWPWLPLLLAGIGLALLKLRGAPAGRGQGHAPEEIHAARICILWIGLLLAVLICIRDPFHRYLLPAYPAMAILTALPIRVWIISWRKSRSTGRLSPARPGGLPGGLRSPAGLGGALLTALLASATWIIELTPLPLTSNRYPDLHTLRAWNQANPAAMVFGLAGAATGHSAALLRVNAGIQAHPLDLKVLEEARRSGDVAVVQDMEYDLPEAILRLQPISIHQGDRFSLYRVPGRPRPAPAPESFSR